jgi:hypothetical protein
MDDTRLLLCVQQDDANLDWIQPQVIGKLGEEITRALQRVPEAQPTPEENKLHFKLLFAISVIDHRLSARAQTSMNSRDGALLVLYRKTFITPTNLQALFRICDTNTKTAAI